MAHRCRVCGERAAVGVPRCSQCSASLLLRCPCCTRPRAVVEVDVLGIVVDVCGACELTFFDAGELAHACGAPTAFASAVRQRASTPSNATHRGGVDVIDIVTFAPVDTIEAVGYGARAAGHVAVTAAGHVAEAVGQVNVVAVAETHRCGSPGRRPCGQRSSRTAGETILEVLASLFN